MLSSRAFTELGAGQIEDAVLAALPEDVFGGDEWATNATHQLVHQLLEAIVSGQGYRFAASIRTVAHAPSLDHVRAISKAVCECVSVHAATSERSSSHVVGLVSQFRRIANETVDQLENELPRSQDAGGASDACATLLQLVAASRPDLFKHLEAVSLLSTRIARHITLADEHIETTRLGALLHDVGLLTTGTNPALAERDPGHVAIGHACLNGIEALEHLAPIVRAHHERFDGGGQPEGLRGAEIPVEARIITVADAFEQLANRPGRSNPIAAAISELWQESGTIYDPDIVAAVTRLFNQHWNVHRTASGAL